MATRAAQDPANPAVDDLYLDGEAAFHRALIAATGNRALQHIGAPIHRALPTAQAPLAGRVHRLRDSVREHRRILDAITFRDPEEARTAMRAHLAAVEAHLPETHHAPPRAGRARADLAGGRHAAR